MKNSILYILFAVLLCACDGTSEGYKPSAGGSKTKEVIEQNINDLESAEWNRSAYIEIKEQQINAFKGTPNQKDALQTKLDYIYGKVMVRDANKILDNCSSKQHKTLNAIMNELKNFAEAPGKAEVEEKYQKHQELLNFIPSMKKLQVVKDFTTKYDRSFESSIRTKVAAYQKTNPTCSYLNSELKKMDTYFTRRRNDYAQKIVDLYCSGTSYSSKDASRVISNINEACKKVSPELREQMEQYKAQFETPTP